MPSTLVISEDTAVTDTIRTALAVTDQVKRVSTIEQAHAKLAGGLYDILFIDLDMIPGGKAGSGFAEAFETLKKICPTIEIIVLASQEQSEYTHAALQAGAQEFLSEPILTDRVKLLVGNIRSGVIQRSELDYLRDQFWRIDAREVVFTNNGQMKGIFKKTKSVAPTKATVLLYGETGTGKGVMARLIHQHSQRQKAQFIGVHCGAIPDTLLESELFGHEKGAFTGAVKRKLGKFEIARGGTIFLDEIATISSAAQIKLLQVLQDGTFSRVGGENTLNTDARVIVATNADLSQMAKEGLFRKDLFYRLNVFPIEIPPLRERVEDLPLFVDCYLERLNLAYQKQITGVRPEVMQALQGYNWPGNVRELENLIERAYILEETRQLTPESFPIELFPGQAPTAILPLDSGLSLAEARKRANEAFERQYLKDLLTRHAGSIKKSADGAGVTTRQIHKLMSRYGIQKEDFRR